MLEVSRFFVHHHDLSVTHLHGCLHALMKPLSVFRAHGKLVDNHFDAVVLVSVDHHSFGQFNYAAIDTRMKEAFFAYAVKQFAVVTFAVHHKRRKKIDALAVVPFKNKLVDLFVGILDHLLTCFITVCFCSP